MAERVGNPVPKEIRQRLERGEEPLVFELVTPPKDDRTPPAGSAGERLATALRADAQHELLLTRNRVVVVSTDRGTKATEIAVSIPLDEIVAIAATGSGTERGRLHVDFRDDSSTDLVMGLLFPRPARRFLAAYDAAMPGGRTSDRKR